MSNICQNQWCNHSTQYGLDECHKCRISVYHEDMEALAPQKEEFEDVQVELGPELSDEDFNQVLRSLRET